MSSNLLEVPLKETEPVDLQSALVSLISRQFTQNAADFAADIRTLDVLRADITALSVSPASLTKLNLYHSHLASLTTKFPADVGIEFSWSNPATSGLTHSRDDLTFERANIFYNIATIYSCLGARENRSTGDGLKKSHQHFQIAAGAYSLLERYLTTVHFLKPEDLQPEYLNCLQKVMLAQAQECIWQRAVLDQMKDKLIAQLSEQVSAFYEDAIKSLERSTAMSASWIHHLSLKKWHFAAAAQVRMASFALSSNKYGEEVARLRLATKFCQKAQQHATYVGPIVAKDLRGLTDHVSSSSLRAEKDNDIIYVIPVPPPDSLPAITPQVMVKPMMIPELEDPMQSLPKDRLLFVNLVPFVIRNLVDVYEQRKQELVSKEIVHKLHALDLEMQALLQDLGLPGSLTVLEQPLGLPHSLVVQAGEIRQSGGSAYLKGLLDGVAALADANSELVEQIVDIIDEESMEITSDEEAPVLTGYREQIDQYRTFLTQAKASDELVQTKLAQWRDRIDLLAADSNILERSVPDAKRYAMSKDSEISARKVRICLNSWDILYTERKTRINHVRQAAEADDIAEDLIGHVKAVEQSKLGKTLPPEEFEPILERHLTRYDAAKDFVTASAEAQISLQQSVKQANAAFLASKTSGAASSDRERVLQELDTAYHKYREIINNLEEGSKFYTDFHKALCRVSDDVKLVVAGLHDQKEQDRRLLVATRELQLESTAGRNGAQGGRDTVTSARQSLTPGTWNPETGITFAGESKRETTSLRPGPSLSPHTELSPSHSGGEGRTSLDKRATSQVHRPVTRSTAGTRRQGPATSLAVAVSAESSVPDGAAPTKAQATPRPARSHAFDPSRHSITFAAPKRDS